MRRIGNIVILGALLCVASGAARTLPQMFY